jgi:Ca-activated chloride channel family protein
VLSLYFSTPLILLLLLLLPPLVWWQLRQRRRAVAFSAVSLVHGLPTGRSTRARITGLVMRTLALALLIIALAGPRWPDEGSRIPTDAISIAIVVDVSYSMTDKDFLWNGEMISRLDAVKQVFKLFVLGGEGPEGQQFPGRSNDLLSLVVFAEYPETVCPLTLDHAALIHVLEKQQARKQEWTNIGDGIGWAVQGLVKSGKGKKVIVLLTDGEQTKAGAALKPKQAAQLAGNNDIPIYAIDAGKDPAELTGAKPDDIKNRQEAKKVLQGVADISQGRYFAAGDSKALLEICQTIDELERLPVESFEYRRYYQGFFWFGLAAFVVLFLILALEMTIWRRVP